MLVATATAVASAAATAGAVVLANRGRKKAQLEVARKRQAQAVSRARQSSGIRHEEIREAGVELRNRLQSELEGTSKRLEEEEAEFANLSKRIDERGARVDERDERLAARFEALKSRRAYVHELKDEVEALDQKLIVTMENIAGQTRDELVALLTRDLKDETQVAAQKAAMAYEEQIGLAAETEARRLIDLASQRYGTALPANRLIASISLPKSAKQRERILADDRAVLEAIFQETEVEFVPQENDSFYLQAPDPFTREIGRVTYERMLKGGQINEGIVKTIAAKTIKDLDKIVRDAGRRAARILKAKNIHPEILYLVGKLLYRTSYTQNQWQHAIETAHLCGLMADELNMDIRLAHRAALMHDIGKVLWAETEAVGSHAVSGAVFAREHGEPPEVVHPIGAHHNDEKPSTPLAHLVAAADALSGARPGARRETLEAYTRRVDDIEQICGKFGGRGIRQAFVIQGGREVRIKVDPKKVDDLAAAQLSREVAEQIEEECVYPGQIKVVVLREIICQSTARA